MVAQPATAPLAPPRSLRRLAGILAIAAGMILLTLLAWSIYYRRQIDDKLSQALLEAATIPAQANQIMRPVNSYSNWLTLGRKREAQIEFIRILHQNTLRDLTYLPYPTPGSFQEARQVISIMLEIARSNDLPVNPQIDAIIQTALKSLPRIRERGTLSSWNAASEFFDFVAERQLTQNTPFAGNYLRWHDNMFMIPEKPLALRDAVETATIQFRAALSQLQVVLPEAGGPIGVLIPGTITDEQYIGVDRLLDSALDMLESYLLRYPEEAAHPQLSEFRARLLFDMGVLKLAHLLERGEAAPRMGSEYIAERVLSKKLNQEVVPTAAQMCMEFADQALGNFMQAAALVEEQALAAEIRPEGAAPGGAADAQQTMRLLYALAHGDMAWIKRLTHKPDTLPREAAEAVAAGLRDSAARAWQEQQGNSRPFLMTQVP